MRKGILSGKVAIVGAGNVGSTTAFALMMDGVVSEIALIDIQKEKAQGEALDLAHCMQFTKVTKIVAGDSLELVKDAQVVVLTCGVSQKPGQTRSDLLSKNVPIFKDIVSQIKKYNADCILLVVANPLDVLTYVSWKVSGFSSCRVFGAGTVLDTARLRYLIGHHFDISPKDITAYILGEHGDSEFVWWSKANIAGVPLEKFTAYDPELMSQIYEKTKNAAYEIISKKGATFYAIALVVVKIIRAILLNQPRVFTVSSVIHNVYGVSDVSLSLPTIIRRSGICEMLAIDLDPQEQQLFKNSAQNIKEDIKKALKFL